MGRPIGAPKSRVPVEVRQPGAGAGGGLPGCPVDRKLPEPVTISVICPTFGRHHFHEALYRSFENQTHEHKDLWVMDDSGPPSPFFTQLRDPRVHYMNLAPWRVTTGCKRNWLIEKSAGSVIAHFDDDDWYAPNYLSSMVDRLVLEDADFVKLAVWNERRQKDGHRWTEHPHRHGDMWGFGFSYVFRRHVASRVHFPDIYNGEDYAFVQALQRAGLRSALVRDGAHWVEHLIHGNNSSKRH